MRPRSPPSSRGAAAERLIAAGQWTPGGPDITIVMDAGYDITPPARALRDLPVALVGRIHSDRVTRLPKPPRTPGVNSRPPQHGPEFRFAKPETWPAPVITTATDTMNHKKAETQAWDRFHPRPTHRSARLEHDGELPLAEDTLVRLHVEHLSKERETSPVWSWSAKTGAAPMDMNLWWQAFLRRSDPEHTFRFEKQTLSKRPARRKGPRLRTPGRMLPTAAKTPYRRGPWRRIRSGEDRWSGFTTRSIGPSATRSLATRWTFRRPTPGRRAAWRGRERLLGHGTPCDYHRARSVTHAVFPLSAVSTNPARESVPHHQITPDRRNRDSRSHSPSRPSGRTARGCHGG